MERKNVHMREESFFLEGSLCRGRRPLFSAQSNASLPKGALWPYAQKRIDSAAQSFTSH